MSTKTKAKTRTRKGNISTKYICFLWRENKEIVQEERT
jgi:hypothetical protein